jgi:2-haloacid dehalogenase
MDLYLQLDAYPEVPETLARLSSAGYATAILSNGSPKMLAAAVGSAGLSASLSAVLSVEDVGIFKPDPRVYQLAVDRLQVAPAEVCFLSSNGWDAAAAAHFGFRVAWINRFDKQQERIPADPDIIIRRLDELLPLLGLE